MHPVVTTLSFMVSTLCMTMSSKCSRVPNLMGFKSGRRSYLFLFFSHRDNTFSSDYEEDIKKHLLHIIVIFLGKRSIDLE